MNTPEFAGIQLFGHSLIEITIGVAMYVVGTAMLLALWRLLRGPTVPDRILALDTLNVTAIAELMLLGMHLRTAIYFEAALIIAMLGFVSTVVLSKYVIRRDIVESTCSGNCCWSRCCSWAPSSSSWAASAW